MKCSYCSYEWNPRKPDPVSCPRCKRRFDYPGRKEGADMLAGAKEMERGYQRTLYVMSVLTPILEERGITPVIVGGSAVEFYTRNWYATADIDLAVQKGKRKVLDEVFKEAGFKRSGRMWTREDLGLYIETPGDIYDIDLEKATKVETGDGYAYMIGVEELILDRLQAAQHWKSQADREQAERLMAVFKDEIEWPYLEKRAKKAEVSKMLKEIRGEQG